MLYIDPSELRDTSKFQKLTSDIPNFKYIQSPGFEKLAGADMLNSPLGGPVPSTSVLLKIHLDVGASLIQIKFDHDLISSIIDGRFKEAQYRMIKAGASYWQCVLLFIGYTSLNKQGQLLINKERPVDIIGGNAQHFDDMKIIHYHKSLWQKRGGRFETILARELPGWLEADLKSTLACQNEPEKLIYAHRAPMTREELAVGDNPSPIEKEWLAAQKLTMVKGLRELLRGLPGINIGRAQLIWQYLRDSDHPRNWYGFHEILSSGEITKIKGIGEGVAANIKRALSEEE